MNNTILPPSGPVDSSVTSPSRGIPQTEIDRILGERNLTQEELRIKADYLARQQRDLTTARRNARIEANLANRLPPVPQRGQPVDGDATIAPPVSGNTQAFDGRLTLPHQGSETTLQNTHVGEPTAAQAASARDALRSLGQIQDTELSGHVGEPTAAQVAAANAAHQTLDIINNTDLSSSGAAAPASGGTGSSSSSSASTPQGSGTLGLSDKALFSVNDPGQQEEPEQNR